MNISTAKILAAAQYGDLTVKNERGIGNITSFTIKIVHGNENQVRYSSNASPLMKSFAH